MTRRGRTGATLALRGIGSEKSRILARRTAWAGLACGIRRSICGAVPDLERSSAKSAGFIVGCHAYCYGLRPKHEQPPDRGKQTACCHHEQISEFRKRHSSRTQASFREFYNGGTLGSAPQDVRSMRDCLLS